MYGEEEEYEVNPRESFYDPVWDPHKKKFNFLDSRNGTVSSHYQKYIQSRELKKKIKNKKNLDSWEDSEIYDTIDELPGFEAQQNREANIINRNAGNKILPSAGLSRAMSYSPSSTARLMKQHKMENSWGHGLSKILSRNNTFKAISPHIISQPKIGGGPMPNIHRKNIVWSNSSARPIRSGAFQRIGCKEIRRY